jgi:hypothetical protein
MVRNNIIYDDVVDEDKISIDNTFYADELNLK